MTLTFTHEGKSLTADLQVLCLLITYRYTCSRFRRSPYHIQQYMHVQLLFMESN